MSERKRQLAAVMFTDIVGFTAMMQKNEEAAVVVRKRHREVFRELHEKHHGKILQYFGDGTLSIFDSAADAVECAVAMQEAFREDPKVPLRIGIHTGDISYDEDGAYGDGMNVASRIEPICTPGGVFISEKVYDDVKNHSWVRAVSLGSFRLKNVYREMELYAITSKGLPIPQITRADTSSYGMAATEEPSGIRKKRVAMLLALFFGIFGAHRFYLGQRKKGMTFLTFFFIGLVLSDLPFSIVGIVAIIAFIDFILLWAMPNEEFDRKYNLAPVAERPIPKEKDRQWHWEVEKTGEGRNPLKVAGVRKFRAGDYRGALSDFLEALKMDEEDPTTHFNLACCYSITKNAEKAFFHLNEAVENGFWDLDRIHNHEALRYVRSLDEFDSFVENDYRLVQKLPAPEENLLDTHPSGKKDLLDQIATLGELMEKGVLTKDEFDQQKKKLLGE
jgi:class 3 adenylate cyclase/TM2 domain-containing membrane protein YozV